MAGGVGSRFWPASREDNPKQFLDILGTGRSLIQMTFDRFRNWVPAEHIFIITNEKYRDLVSSHLPELSQEQIIGEPSRNNTAPCVAYASMKLYKLNPEAVCVVAPADHVILKEQAFLDTAQRAAQFADQKGALLTLGITPTRPDTGYGYIDFDHAKEASDGVFKVKSFKEKPVREVAEEYLKAGHYLWNSGMFIWKLESILKAFETHSPGIYEILSEGMDVYNTAHENEFVSRAYPTTERISIDYAIMERAQNVYTVPAEIGWSDLGTWNSLFEKMTTTGDENITLGTNIFLDESKGCIVKNLDGRLLVARGLENFIVVQDEKSTLIYPKSEEQGIKSVTKHIREQGLEEYL